MYRAIGVLLVLVLSSCSAFRPYSQTVKIDCNVPGTVLRVNSETKECPAAVEVRRNRKMTVDATKKGYDTYRKEVENHLSWSGYADIVGTAVVFFPVFGLLAPAAWDLDETDIHVVLNKMD